MSYKAHIQRNSWRGVRGAKLPGKAGGFGGPPGHPMSDVAMTSTPRLPSTVLPILPPLQYTRVTYGGPLEYNVYSARQLAGTSAHVQCLVDEAIQHALRVGGFLESQRRDCTGANNLKGFGLPATQQNVEYFVCILKCFPMVFKHYEGSVKLQKKVWRSMFFYFLGCRTFVLLITMFSHKLFRFDSTPPPQS